MLGLRLICRERNLLVKANGCVKNIPKFKFCYADINCCLKFKWEVSGTSGSVFISLNQLKLLTEDDESIDVVIGIHISTQNLCFSFIINLWTFVFRNKFFISIGILVIKLQLSCILKLLISIAFRFDRNVLLINLQISSHCKLTCSK